MTQRERREWAYREARKHAEQGTDMAVGWQINDTTGERELGFCPLSAVGPAFVLDVEEVIPGRAADVADSDCRNSVPAYAEITRTDGSTR